MGDSTVWVLPGVYTESLVIDKDIDILAYAVYSVSRNAASTTIIQAAALTSTAVTRVISISGNSEVFIGGFTIQNGAPQGNVHERQGGCIYNNGSLKLEYSVVRYCDGSNGSGIFSTGILQVFYSTIEHNHPSMLSAYGVGIYNAGGVMTITLSVIQDNTSQTGKGGGIYSEDGFVKLVGSNIMFNTAVYGSGIYSWYDFDFLVQESHIYGNSGCVDGGGINNYASVMRINQSAITENSCQNYYGGGIYNDGLLLITNTTIAQNQAHQGGGVYNKASVTITHATIANNSANFGSEIWANGDPVMVANSVIANNSPGSDCNLPIISAGYNINTDGSCITDGVNHDRVVADPLLGPLHSHPFGTVPSQAWYLPLAGSQLVDAIPTGVNGCGTSYPFDQLWTSRPFGLGCDIGATEVGSYDLVLTKTASNVTPTPGEAITYTLVISNRGPGWDQGVVSDTLPVEVTFVPGSISIEPAVGLAGNAPPEIASGLVVSANTQVTITVVATINLGQAAGTSIFNLATLTSPKLGLPYLDVSLIHVGNAAPIAFDDLATVGEDAGPQNLTTLLLDNDQDLNNDLLAINALNGLDVDGSLSLTSGNVWYSPNGQFESLAVGETSQDLFEYVVTDGSATDTGLVTITITGVNDPPVANPDSGPGFTTSEDAAFTTGNVLANDNDPDLSDVLYVAAYGSPAHGNLLYVNNGQFNYDPNGLFNSLAAGEVATETFTYRVTDQRLSDTTLVTLTITGVNDPPSAHPDSGLGYTTGKNTAFVTGNVLVNDTDPDTHDTLTVSNLDTSGTLGLVTNNGDGTFDYDPDGQFAGLGTGQQATDTFVYQVTDGTAFDTAVVTITIQGGNQPPVGHDDSGVGFVTNEDNAFLTASVLANDTDPDPGDVLSVVGFTFEALGSVAYHGGGQFNYNPDGQFEYLAAGEQATDSFSYVVSDGEASDTAAVTITINGVNDPPVAADDQGPGFQTDEETAFDTPNILLNDTDPDATDVLTVTAYFTSGTTGAVTYNGDGTFQYTPWPALNYLSAGEVVRDAFSYLVSDQSTRAQDSGVVFVDVTGLNDAPQAAGDNYNTDEGSLIIHANLLANDSDPDHLDTIFLSSVGTAGTQGVVTIQPGSLIDYNPIGAFEYLAAGEVATDTFTYLIRDRNNPADPLVLTDYATVTIRITGLNDLPMAVPDGGSGFTTNEDTAFSTGNVLANDSDPDTSNTLAVIGLNTAGTIGLVTNNSNGTFTYSPNGKFEYLLPGQSTTDSFTYTLSDGTATDMAVVTIQIWGVNDGPIVYAGEDETTIEGVYLTFIAVYTDPGRLAEAVTAHWDFGDGQSYTGLLNVNHAYMDDGVYVATLYVTDTLGAVGMDTKIMTITNFVPMVNAGEDITVTSGTVVNLLATFQDTGMVDTHTAQVDWGDGHIEALAVNQAAKQATGQHVYTASGEYTVTVTVTDDDASGTDIMIIHVTGYRIYLPLLFR